MPTNRERSRLAFGRFRRGGTARIATTTLGHQNGWDKRLVQSLTSARLPTWRQIRHLPEVLSSSDSFRLRLGGVLLAIGLVTVGAAFYYAHTVFGPAVGGEIVEGAVGTPRSLNPILSVSNDVDGDLMRLMYSRLFTTDGTGQPTPDLVESYNVSPDQKTYMLTLRGDAKWHDGQPLTPDDVLFTFGLIQDPAWKSPLRSVFADMTFEKAGDRTIRITLKEPYAPFLSLLNVGILPRHVWKAIGPQDVSMAEADLKPVGSGPYAFEEMHRDKRGFVLSYSLKRNAGYYAQPPYVERLTFEFFPDYPTALEALRKRQITSLSFVPRDMRGELRGLAHVAPVSLGLPQTTAVFFNPERNPALKDRDVRRALAMSIDKVRVIFDALSGDGRPLDHPALPGWSATTTNPLPFNPEAAATLLDGAGWKIDPASGQRMRVTPADAKTKKAAAQETLRITLTGVDQPESLHVASIIKAGWSALGADVTIEAVPPSDIHRTVIAPRQYQALLYGQLLGADADPYPFWHSSQIHDPGLNLAMFANRDADAALDAARTATDENVRQAAYRTFLGVLADQVPAAFLYSPSYTYAIPSALKGFRGTWVNAPSDRFATVTSWYLKTARIWKK